MARREANPIENEHGTIFGTGRYRIALAYPNPYRVAGSSLGFQVIYRLFNEHPDVFCERVVLPDDVEDFKRSRKPLCTLESSFPVGGADCLAISLAFEPDLACVFQLMELAKIPCLRSDRGDAFPPVILGGPITMSNALPMAPFADVIVMGDGEGAVGELTEALLQEHDGGSRGQLLERLAAYPGFYVPAIHGEKVPDMIVADRTVLPAVGQTWSPDTELGNMFLIEASRGCPRYCTFCVMRATAQPMREADPQVLINHMNIDAPRIGFVGAAVSEYTHIKPVMREALSRGYGLGISSLRADRLDEEFVGLLRDGGYRTMTVASDAPSQALRGKLKKGLRGKHLIRSAELAAWAKLDIFKLYVIIGLPGETLDDIDELAQFALELRKIIPRVALGLSALVPKLHTPLGDAEFTPIPTLEKRVKYLRNKLAGKVEIRSISPRWAWIEYRLSQGGIATGLAAYEAHLAGNRYADYKRAFNAISEPPRRALEAAAEFGLWQPSGMK